MITDTKGRSAASRSQEKINLFIKCFKTSTFSQLFSGVCVTETIYSHLRE
jgi:hypothetical protein